MTTTSPIVPQTSSHYDPLDLIQLDESGGDQQWHMVSSSKSHRKGTISRRETPEESQKSDKTPKFSSTEPSMYLFFSLSSRYVFCIYLAFIFFSCLTMSPSLLAKSLLLTSTSRTHKPIQSSRRYNHLTHTPFPISVPIRNQRKSFQDNSSLITTNRELAFLQLTEQLWTTDSPSSTTACSMSIRSRRSSAPLSERGGDNEIETIDWDDADTPDSGNRTRLYFVLLTFA